MGWGQFISFGIKADFIKKNEIYLIYVFKSFTIFMKKICFSLQSLYCFLHFQWLSVDKRFCIQKSQIASFFVRYWIVMCTIKNFFFKLTLFLYFTYFLINNFYKVLIKFLQCTTRKRQEMTYNWCWSNILARLFYANIVSYRTDWHKSVVSR
jgi:hypothetical protein